MNFEKIIQELEFFAVRSRGPGGQNVNKVSSAALLSWDYSSSPHLSPEEKTLISLKLSSYINKEDKFFLRSEEFRDLIQNKRRCAEKLKGLLELAFHKAKTRKASRPTRASQIRKSESKIRRAQHKKSRQKVKPWD